ncbi:ATP-binding protein [Pseudomonas sp. Marseille-QA0892]
MRSGLLVIITAVALFIFAQRVARSTSAVDKSLHPADIFRSLFDAYPGPVWLYDRDTLQMVWANPAARHTYGYGPEDIERLTLQELIVGLPVARESESDQEYDEAILGARYLRNKDGSPLPAKVNGANCSIGGRALGLLIVEDGHVDIEPQARRGREQRELACRVAKLGHWQYDVQSGIGECSSEVCRLIGWAPSQTFDWTAYSAAVLEADRDRIEEAHRRAARAGHAAHRYRIRTLSGDVRSVYERIELVTDPSNGTRVLFGALVDLSELESVDERLIRQRTLYERMINSFPEGVVVIRGEEVHFANEAARAMLFAERPSTRVFAQYVHPDVRARELDRMIALQKGVISESPLRQVPLVRADGSLLEAEIIEIRLEDKGPSDVQLLIRDVSQNRRMQRDLEDANRRLQALSQRLIEIQETERRQLARDLHDDIGQQLTGLKIHLQRVMRRADEGAARPPMIQGSIETLDLLLATVRRLSLALHPLQLESLGLEAAMQSHLRKFLDDPGIRWSFKTEGDLVHVPAPTALVAFRVFQEAVNNIVRHARAKNIQVNVQQLTDGIRLDVIDDGRGFDVTAAHQRADSLGLTSMHERVASLGGELRISSLGGIGTRVTAWLPQEPKRVGDA